MSEGNEISVVERYKSYAHGLNVRVFCHMPTPQSVKETLRTGRACFTCSNCGQPLGSEQAVAALHKFRTFSFFGWPLVIGLYLTGVAFLGMPHALPLWQRLDARPIVVFSFCSIAATVHYVRLANRGLRFLSRLQ